MLYAIKLCKLYQMNIKEFNAKIYQPKYMKYYSNI